MATITKKDLIDRITQKCACRRSEAKRVIQCFLDELIQELGKGNRLEFRDFGVFETKKRAPRVAQNPKTLQRVNVPAKRTVKFKVGRMLKDHLDRTADGGDGLPKPKIVIQSDISPNGRLPGKSRAGGGGGDKGGGGVGAGA